MALSKASQLQTQPAVVDASPLSNLSTNTETVEHLSIMFESLWGRLFPAQGSLLLDYNGQLLLSTPKARALCQSIHWADDESGETAGSPCLFELPTAITNLCELLIDSLEDEMSQHLQLQEELFDESGLHIQIKGEWVELGETMPKCILVTLEDLAQVACQRSRCDAHRYNFTARETEVWALYLQGLSYREIGRRLYIAVSTVKKHLKSAQSKRRGEAF